jgi:hypothetical protein
VAGERVIARNSSTAILAVGPAGILPAVLTLLGTAPVSLVCRSVGEGGGCWRMHPAVANFP